MEMRSRKLSLSKETLRTLDDDQLVDVVGGAQTNGLVCVGQSVVCQSAVCGSGAVCNSAVCQSAVCNSVAICGPF